MAAVSISTQLPPISIATPSRDAASVTSSKGLLNRPGQNNCFLNSAVQVLWHLDIFRRSFRDLSGHACMAESCIFCALKELFAQLQFSHETALPPDALRRALAESFFDQQRFQLGFMDDAAECFENMLLRIHMHIANEEAEDMCSARHCIPHQKFAMTLVEQSICRACGATSEPLSFTQMVHYVSASALTTQMRQNMSSVVGHVFPNSFGDLLCKAGSMGDIRDCPSSCGAKIQICRTLMNRPEIVSVGIVWDSERPTLEHIMDVFATVGTTLKLGEIFHSVVDSRWAEITSHHLVGVVTYYGKHYSTFFFHSKLKVWIYFDDATVREVGSKWEQVVEKCRKGRYQPLLLLYAVPTGTPVSTDNAPKLVTSLHSDRTLTKKPPIQSFLRRSITPSPEKPNIGNMRRAITPNPDGSLNHALETSNEYQNLSVIQSNLCGARTKSDVDVVDCGRRMSPDYNSRTFPTKVSQVTVQRTNSSGSSSGIEAGGNENFCGSRRRDSGSWSGDRNSASSCSSTTMENPYLYLVGKVPNRNNAIPSSPTRTKCDSSSSSAVYDAGYDSYSLSSNDSTTMSTIQHLMKMGHLAKIPEDYSNNSASPSLSCDTLCDEADELLVKSRQLEDEHDLVLALALCNAAATKARAAMNAPYNNPQILTLARMKHNTCIMRARSLHRRMTQTQSAAENPPEIRHTREGSSGSGRHSRQNSRDKTSHSRQNSRELLVQPPQENTYPQAKKNIEIYATLPKRKDGLKNKTVNINIGEDEEYMLYDKPAREARSIFSRSKNKEVNKTREKRSRSEDRSKISGDFSIASEIVVEPNTDKKIKEDEKKDGKNKKQHKIRRKLLMGGLIKRKNRSMPDLTEASNNEKRPIKPTSSVDDSNVGVAKSEKLSSMCGYLSEGHLEFTGTGTNPNLERSRLMRKSFHGSAGKVLTAAKVPPPPPLRTTSQLSSSKLNEHVCDSKQDSYYVYRKEPISLPSNYVSQNSAATRNIRSYENHYGCTPEGTVTSYDINTVQTLNTVITRADVHQEQSPHRKEYFDQVQPPTDIGVDEVDCFVQRNSPANLDLPPYPSPANSVVHSRQPSEDFPPPPPPLDLSALDEHLVDNHTSTPTIMHHHPQDIPSTKNSGDTWLHELQARQAALKAKKAESAELGIDVVNTQKCTDKNGSSKINSVRDLASRFENIQLEPANKNPTTAIIPKLVQNGNIVNELDKNISHAGIVSLKKWGENEALQSPHLPVEQKNQEIIHCAEEKSSLVNDTSKKLKVGKKKSVSFCDQVILVATAEEQEDDSYIPNPILERVLRSAINKPETAAIQQEILRLREAEQKKNELNKLAVQSVTPEPRDIYNMETNNFDTQSRQNSTENLLNKTTLPVSNEIQQSQQMNAVNSQYGAQYMPVQNAQRVHQTTAYNAQTLHRESPYQQMQYPFKGIPHVTGAYPAPNQQQSPASQPYNCDLNTENVQYGPPQRNINVQNQNMRSSPCQPYPLPCQQYMHPGYPHQQFTRNPNPSPSPSVCNEYYPQNQGTHNVYQTGPSGNGTNYTPYHKVPMPPQQATPPYQQVPYNTQQQYYQQNFQRTVNYNDQNGSQMAPGEEVYYSQRPARSTNCINYPNGAYNNGQDMGKYSPYQHVLPPKQMPNKYVGAENGPRTCGEQQSVPVGGKINGQLQVKNKCNLCRKKLVTAPNSYCMDCEFYMSRFKPKN